MLKARVQTHTEVSYEGMDQFSVGAGQEGALHKRDSGKIGETRRDSQNGWGKCGTFLFFKNRRHDDLHKKQLMIMS